MKSMMLAAGMVAVLALTGAAGAENYTWTAAVDTNWTTPGNWTGGTAGTYPDDATDTATFNAIKTVTVNATVTIGGMTVTANTTTFTGTGLVTAPLTMDGGAATVSAAVLGGSLTVNTGAALTTGAANSLNSLTGLQVNSGGTLTVAHAQSNPVGAAAEGSRYIRVKQGGIMSQTGGGTVWNWNWAAGGNLCVERGAWLWPNVNPSGLVGNLDYLDTGDGGHGVWMYTGNAMSPALATMAWIGNGTSYTGTAPVFRGLNDSKCKSSATIVETPGNTLGVVLPGQTSTTAGLVFNDVTWEANPIVVSSDLHPIFLTGTSLANHLYAPLAYKQDAAGPTQPLTVHFLPTSRFTLPTGSSPLTMLQPTTLNMWSGNTYTPKTNWYIAGDLTINVKQGACVYVRDEAGSDTGYSTSVINVGTGAAVNVVRAGDKWAHAGTQWNFAPGSQIFIYQSVTSANSNLALPLPGGGKADYLLQSGARTIEKDVVLGDGSRVMMPSGSPSLNSGAASGVVLRLAKVATEGYDAVQGTLAAAAGGTLTINRRVDFGTGRLVIGDADGDYTAWSGSAETAGFANVATTGTVVLVNADAGNPNTMGAIDILSGTLRVGGAYAVPATVEMIIANSAQGSFDVYGYEVTLKKLKVNGVGVAPGDYGAGFAALPTGVLSGVAGGILHVLNPFAIPGDADLNGYVDLPDLIALARNWKVTPASWGQGDFDGDNIVDLPDLIILARNWHAGSLPPAAGGAVPEPASLVLLALGAVALIRRRPR